MANFLRSFATGFVSAANRRFSDDRAAKIKSDAAKSKLLHEKVLPAYAAEQIKANAATKKKTDDAKLRADLGITPLGEARISSGVGTAENAVDFRKSLTPEQLKQAQGSTFIPRQPAQQSISDFAASYGFTEQDLKDRGVDITKSPGAPGAAPSFTGGGLDIGQVGQTTKNKRLEALAKTFVTKQLFPNQKTFAAANKAFVAGDYEGVIMLAEQESKAASRILDPILNKLMGASELFAEGKVKSVFEVLNPVETQLFFLLRNIDPLAAAVQQRMLFNPTVMNMLLRVRDQDEAAGKNPPPAPEKPPGPDASDEEKAEYSIKNFPRLQTLLDYVFGKNDPDKTQ